MISAHMSQVASQIRCRRKSILSLDLVESSENEPLLLGSKVHEIIKNKMMDAPYEIGTLEAPVIGPLIDTFNPLMFLKKLEFFEYPIKQIIRIEGEDIEISGTIDAMSSDGQLIVDWKTASMLYNDTNFQAHSNYVLQIALYRLLYLKQNQAPLSEGFGIIGYIVKTKTPKFKALPFKINLNLLQYAQNNLIAYCKDIIAYKASGVVPDPSFNQYCTCCSVQERCLELSPINPEFITLARLKIEGEF